MENVVLVPFNWLFVLAGGVAAIVISLYVGVMCSSILRVKKWRLVDIFGMMRLFTHCTGH